MRPGEPRQQAPKSKPANSTQDWWKRLTYIGGAVLAAVAVLFASGYIMDAIRHAIISFKQLKMAITV